MSTWCKNMYGNKVLIRSTLRWNQMRIYFDDISDAVAFKIRWTE